MIYLDFNTKKLEAVLAGAATTAQPEISAYYYDHVPASTTTVRRGGVKVTSTNNTTDVTIVEAPTMHGTIRNVHTIMVHNKDSVDCTVTVKMDDSGTETILVKQTLQTGETLSYEDGAGWTISTPISPPFIDTYEIVHGSSDATKRLRIEVDGITTGTQRVWTVADSNIVVAGHQTGFTSGRVPYATGSTGGVLTDSSTFTFDGTNVTVPGLLVSSDAAPANVMVRNTGSGTASSNGAIFGIESAGANAYVWNYENGTLYFGTNNSTRWTINASGDLIATGDLFIRTGDGTVSEPAYTFTSDTDMGLYYIGAGRLGVAASGAKMAEFASNYFSIGPSTDVNLFRDAAGTLALRNGTTAQAFRIYNTFTDASNYEALWIWASSNIFRIETVKSGTGTARSIRFGTDGTARWEIGATSGHLLPVVDNTYDIGASGATRPRNIYVSGDIVVGDDITCDQIFASNVSSGSVFGTTTALNNTTGSIGPMTIYMRPNATITGTYHSRMINGVYAPAVQTGVTQSGLQTAFWLSALRNYANDGNGTASDLACLRLEYGHFNTDVVSPVTTSAIGLTLSPYTKTGTISNLYGILVSPISTGGTTTNAYALRLQFASASGHYNIYADGSAANYLAGYLALGNGAYSATTSNLNLGTNSGTTQFVVAHTASAVNYLTVAGAPASSEPEIYAAGSDTDISIEYGAKGAGVHDFWTNWGTAVRQFQIGHTDSAVNYLRVAGAATGSDPNITAQGSDASVTLALGSKGSGSVDLLTNSTRQFRVAHTASAVNYIQVTGNITTASPSISAVGSDTNVSLVLQSKGSGVVSLRTDSGTQQFRVTDTTNAVNYISVTGGATGLAPRIVFTGSDTNIGGLYITTGSGTHAFYTDGSATDIQFQIIHVDASVNYIRVQGAATGNAVTISAQGTDTNVGFNIEPKGNGKIYLKGPVALTDDLSPAQITASQNNYAPTSADSSGILRLNSNARWNITGLADGSDGRVFWIYNVGTFPIVFTYEDTNSTAANRFAFGCTLGGGQGMAIWYDSTSSRWRPMEIPEPIGTIKDFAGGTIPAGFLGCDGAAVSRTTYAALFNEIGTTWGTGDGSTTFNVPNFQRRVAVGSGGSGTATLSNTVGSTGGAETHTLDTSEIPAHAHGVSHNAGTVNSVTNDRQAGADPGFANPNASASISTNNAGGGGAHNNMQPSAVVLKIIKY